MSPPPPHPHPYPHLANLLRLLSGVGGDGLEPLDVTISVPIFDLVELVHKSLGHLGMKTGKHSTLVYMKCTP